MNGNRQNSMLTRGTSRTWHTNEKRMTAQDIKSMPKRGMNRTYLKLLMFAHDHYHHLQQEKHAHLLDPFLLKTICRCLVMQPSQTALHH